MTQPDSILVDFEDIIHIRCKGNSDGQATAIYNGGLGFGSYSIVWTDSLNNIISLTPEANNLSLGYYVTTYTDNNGCIGFDTIVINESEILKINNQDSVTTVSCLIK